MHTSLVCTDDYICTYFLWWKLFDLLYKSYCTCTYVYTHTHIYICLLTRMWHHQRKKVSKKGVRIAFYFHCFSKIWRRLKEKRERERSVTKSLRIPPLPSKWTQFPTFLLVSDVISLSCCPTPSLILEAFFRSFSACLPTSDMPSSSFEFSSKGLRELQLLFHVHCL